jgi:hypothetical protein
MNMVLELLQSVGINRSSDKHFPALANVCLAQAGVHAGVNICDGKLVGFGSLFLLNRLRGGCLGIIKNVVVAPDLRG